MNEDFVPFELAEKLKEEGYNKPFYFYYRTDDECIHHVNTCAPLVYSDKIDDEVVIAPTISQVLKWLRKENGLHIEIRLFCVGYGFDIIRIKDRKKLAWSGTDERDNYEQAALAGIEYALTNLI